MERIVAAGAVLALWAGAAHGEGWALGLELPKEALSVWKVGESSAWGLEIDANRTRNQEEIVIAYRLEPEGPEERKDAWEYTLGESAGIALFYQRAGEFKHNVRPFLFSRGGTGFSAFTVREYEPDRISYWSHADSRMVFLEGSVGIGMEWKPLERVGLWIRRGLEVNYEYFLNDQPFKAEDLEGSYIEVGFGHPEVVAVFSF